MHTPGVDPCSYLAEASWVINTLTQRDQIETVLDEVGYLFETEQRQVVAQRQRISLRTGTQEPGQVATGTGGPINDYQ